MREKRFDRGAWLTLAVVVAWIVLVPVLMVVSLSFPTDGWIHDGPEASGAYTTADNISGAVSPLQSGDVIQAINGQALSPDWLPPFPPNLEPGQVLAYTIQRNGQKMDVDITLVKPGLPAFFRHLQLHLENTLDVFIPSLLSFLIAGLIFYLRPGNLGARYLVMFFGFYFASNFGFALSSLYVHSLPASLQLLNGLMAGGAWFWFFFPTLTLLALAFPVVKLPLRRFPLGIHLFLYGIPFLCLLIAASLTILTRQTRWMDTSLIPVMLSMLGLAMITLFGSLIHNWRTLSKPARGLNCAGWHSVWAWDWVCP